MGKHRWTFTSSIRLFIFFLFCIKSASGAQSIDRCTFESIDRCGYFDDEDATIPWTRHSSHNGSSSGPAGDHTLGTGQGHYMLLNSTSRSRGDTARLVSPYIEPTSNVGTCLEFYYYLPAKPSRAALHVYTRGRDQTLKAGPIWSRQAPLVLNRSQWHAGQVTLSSAYSFQILFEGVVGDEEFSDVAIDDILIHPYPCQPPGSCDFEKDSCLFHNQGPNNLNWVRMKGEAAVFKMDSTLRNSQGHMMYASNQKNIVADDNVRYAKMATELLPETNASCLTFNYWYLQESGSVGFEVHLGAYEKLQSSLKWSAKSQEQRHWKKVWLNVSSTQSYSIVFTARFEGEGTVAVDDVLLVDGQCSEAATFVCDESSSAISQSQVCDFIRQCPNGEDESKCGSCDFELDLCGLFDVSRGPFSWNKSKIESNSKTESKLDHNNVVANGDHLYVQWKPNGLDPTPAVLITPIIQSAYQTCVYQFYYKGTTAANLAVYVETGIRSVLAWRSIANDFKTDDWIRARVHVGRMATPFQLSIKASGLTQSQQDIAIDNTRFINCQIPTPCSSQSTPCRNKVCIDTIHKCDLADDCGDYSDEDEGSCRDTHQCTLENDNGLCKWRQSTHDDLDWTRHSGPIGNTDESGPSRDHTTNSDAGSYLYLRSSFPSKPGQKARLLSPVINPTSKNRKCYLTFYYHMFGKEMGPLRVYTMAEEKGNVSLIFDKQNFRQNYWARAVLFLAYQEKFVVVFEGVVGSTLNEGNMAIDDISLSSGCVFAEPDGAKTATDAGQFESCPRSQNQCKDGDCIDESKWCDATSDCKDGSDETECGPCNFDGELGYCGWKDTSTGRVKWSLSNALGLGAVTPSNDVDTSGSTGHYVYIQKDYGISSDPAILRSPPLESISIECVVSFDYSINPAHRGILSMNVNNGGAITQIWSSYNRTHIDSSWNKAHINVGEITGELPLGVRFEISFISPTSVSSASLKIASVDNISFSGCNQQNSVLNVDCNFDTGLCNWHQSKIDSGDWLMGNEKKKPDYKTGPLSAHNGKGDYVYIDSSQIMSNGTVDLETISLPPTPPAGSCFSFWYFTYGRDVGRLQLIYRNVANNSQQIVWSTEGSQVPKWQERHVHITGDFKHTLIFRGITTNGREGDIALDDFRLQKGRCQRHSTCTFEYDFCDWTSVSWNYSKPFPSVWERRMSETPSRGTAAYTSGASREHNSTLISKAYLPGEFQRGGCFTFAFYRKGQIPGGLDVMLVSNQTETKIWYSDYEFESLSSLWKRVSVPIKPIDTAFQLKLVSWASGERTIGIDDLFVSNDNFCEAPASCSFEDGLCSFVNVMGSDMQTWALHSGQRRPSTSAPRIDHTTGTDQGFYLSVETSTVDYRSGHAILISEDLPATSHGCLSFWFYVRDSTLNVHYRAPSNKTLIWSFSGAHGSQWQEAKISISSPNTFELMFEGLYKGKLFQALSLDDITYSVGHMCSYEPSTTVVSPTHIPIYEPTPLDCSFETDSFCSWSNLRGGDSEWVLVSSDISRNVGSDHTLGNMEGHYIIAQGTRHINTYRHDADEAVTQIVSPEVSVPVSGICFKFWYHMYGSKVGRLDVYIKSAATQKSQLVWTRIGTQGPDWKYSQIHIQDVSGNASVVLQVKYFHKLRDVVYPSVDDISMNYGPCPATQTCDFEDGFCQYLQSLDDDFDWQLNIPGNITLPTGPTNDHTFKTSDGHYAFIDGSPPRKHGNKARIRTNRQSPTFSSCLWFWYNMNGKTVGTLNVWMEKASDGVGNKPIWTKSGNQGSAWQLAQAPISSSFSFKIVFEGITGSGRYSNIAIDDVSLKPGDCPDLGTCQFEDEHCSWTNVEGDDGLDWTRESGYTDVVSIKYDHTLNTKFGRFMNLATKDKINTGLLARYVSPPLSKDKAYCFTMWYTLRNKGNISVILRDLVMNTEGTAVFTTSQSTTKWTQLRRSVGPVRENFRAEIVGSVASTYGSISIDDLAIQEGLCESLPSPPSTKNAFQCSPGGRHVSRQEVCNFNYDCPRGEEEVECGYNCNFENKTCKWERSTISSHFVWMLLTGNDGKGPSTDGTLNAEDGHYYSLQVGRRGVSYRNPAMLRSPLLQRSAPDCELEVSIIYRDVYRGSLEFIKYNGDEKTVLFAITDKTYRPTWQRLIIAIGENEAPFMVSIEAKIDYQLREQIAVDDLFFRNCEYPQPKSSCTTTNTFMCKNKACVHPYVVCDNKNNCGDGSDESTETCSSYDRCSFESGICDWSQEKYKDEFDWVRKKATQYHKTGPSADHTTGIKTGHFMAIASTSSYPGSKAWLMSPVLRPTPLCSFRFALHMYGSNIDKFTVYTRSSSRGQMDTIFSESGEAGDFWRAVNINITSSSDFQIVLEGINGEGMNDEIAIDDVVLEPGCEASPNALPITPLNTFTTESPCGNPARWQCADKSQCIYKSELCDFIHQCEDMSDERDCGECNFESSMCGWQDQSKGTDFWDRVESTGTDKSKSPTINSNGSYVNVRSQGYGYTRPALLVSPLLGSTEAECSISFYLKLRSYSQTTELLLAHKRVGSFEILSEDIIRLWGSGYRASLAGWTKETVSIGSKAAGFRLIFKYYDRLKRGQSPALDDISFSKGCGAAKSANCSHGEFVCISTHECKPVSAKCDFAKDCQHGEDEKNCDSYLMFDFETSSSLGRDFSSDFYWSLYRPSTSSISSAPDRDHTYGNPTGHFMYIKPSDSSGPHDVARMKGPIMYGNPYGSCYMTLFYHLNGNYKDAINIYTETKVGGKLDLKKSVNKEQGDEWKKLVIRLVEKTTFRVVIEGVRGKDYRGDIGIDDVSFAPHCVLAQKGTLLPQRSSLPDPGPGCKTDVEFLCDGKCVQIDSNWCNFRADCKDGVDEASCPSDCDFETGLCGWTHGSKVSSHQFKVTPASNTKAKTDHNPGNSKGHFLSSSSTSLYSYHYQNSLVSPLYRSSSPNCKFSFWFMQHTQGSLLTVYLRTSGTDEVLWYNTLQDDVMSSWEHKIIQLPSCTSEFQIILSHKTNKRGYVPTFLDDFSFNGCSLEIPDRTCNPGEFRCSNKVCIDIHKLCDLENDCCDGSDEDLSKCYHYRKSMFESDMNGWKLESGSNSWERYTTSKSKYYYGPNSDHTTHSFHGHYLNQRCPAGASGTGTVMFDMPAPIGECVVTFWYQLFGAKPGTINVLVKTPDDRRMTLARVVSNKTGSWERQRVTVGDDVTEHFKLIFEGVCSSRYSFASNCVDDVVFSPECNVKAIHPPPPSIAAVSSTTAPTRQTTTTPSMTTSPTTTKRISPQWSTVTTPSQTATQLSTRSTTRAKTTPVSITPSTEGSLGSNHGKSQNESSSSEGDWKRPVGIVLGLLAFLAIVAGVSIFLYRTKRIGCHGISIIPWRRRPSLLVDTDGREHSNPVYFLNLKRELPPDDMQPETFHVPDAGFQEPSDQHVAF